MGIENEYLCIRFLKLINNIWVQHYLGTHIYNIFKISGYELNIGYSVLVSILDIKLQLYSIDYSVKISVLETWSWYREPFLPRIFFNKSYKK